MQTQEEHDIHSFTKSLNQGVFPPKSHNGLKGVTTGFNSL